MGASGISTEVGPLEKRAAVAGPGDESWSDWRWQQRRAIRTSAALRHLFPGVPDSETAVIDRHIASMRFQVTRYYLSLIRRTPDGKAPDPDDPLWKQILPSGSEDSVDASYRYDRTDNWELPHEMVTPIAQRKYDDRIAVRLSNVCHAYCQFCYEARRTLERESDKATFAARHWADTVAFVRDNPEIDEVILSGGEPLIQRDEQLEQVFADLRSIARPLAIRIHTRALTFNPFRVTDDLVDLLARYEVNAIGLHVAHVNEVSPEFASAVKRLQRAVPVLFTNIPLLSGVNNSPAAIHELSMTLYLLGVVRGYLYHFMPHSPSSGRFRTSVQEGVDIVKTLKRRVSNLAVPEFVLPHHTGKHSMPLVSVDEPPPRRVVAGSGGHVVRYTNWRGEQVDYPDPPIE